MVDACSVHVDVVDKASNALDQLALQVCMLYLRDISLIVDY